MRLPGAFSIIPQGDILLFLQGHEQIGFATLGNSVFHIALRTCIYVGRLPVYTTFYGYMSLPWVIDAVFERDSARVIKCVMIVCYLGFFYIQMHSTWGYF